MTDEERWNTLTLAEREACARRIATDGVTFTGLDERGRAWFMTSDRPLVLVPGGRVQLGWARGPLALTPEQRTAWREGGPVPGRRHHPVPLGRQLLRRRLGARPPVAPAGRCGLEPRWPASARRYERPPRRRNWPPGNPHHDPTPLADHPFGLRFDSDPYWTELVAGELRGGDGGTDLCGGVPEPVAWRSQGCAFRPAADLWTDLLEVSLECGVIRRVRTVRIEPD